MVGVRNEWFHYNGEFIDEMNNYQLHRDSLDNGSDVSAAGNVNNTKQSTGRSP
jgi:hypothetical protein